jgi:hypothetical protein
MIRMMIRSAVLALVVSSLIASTAFAAPRASRTAPAPAQGLAAVWEWVTSVFDPVMPVSKAPGGGIMEKAGSRMDPEGTPFLGTVYSGSTTEAGPGMDPDGR